LSELDIQYFASVTDRVDICQVIDSERQLIVTSIDAELEFYDRVNSGALALIVRGDFFRAQSAGCKFTLLHAVRVNRIHV